MNILVLDNDSLLNWAISFGLQKEKHMVFNCFNENEATVVLESQQIDITISELMTGKTELNFLPFIKEPILFIIPIVIISKLLSDPKIIEQYKLNCVAFNSKPINPLLIIDEVNRISNKKNKKHYLIMKTTFKLSLFIMAMFLFSVLAKSQDKKTYYSIETTYNKGTSVVYVENRIEKTY